MNKGQEDERRHTVSENPKWKDCLDTMTLVKTVELAGGGVRAEFVDSEGRGTSIDIVDSEYEEFKKLSKKEELEKPAKKGK